MKVNTARKMGLAVSAGFLMTLSAVAAAWACTQSAYLEAANPQKAPAGDKITVAGGSFGPGPVEIRWNSASGPVVASTRGPSFTAAVTAPSGTSPGIFYIVAVQKDSRGTILGKGSTALEVLPASGGQASSPVASASSPFGTGGFSAPADKPGSEARAVARPGSTLLDAGEQGAASNRDDLWSGFAGQPGSIGPALTAPAQTGAGSGTGMVAGMALLAAGVIASGTVVALQARGRMSRASSRR